MKIIVTGGNGQIGSHVIELLIKENVDQIINIDNFITGKKYHLLDHEKLIKINGSIDDSILISKTFEKFKPNIIIHTAASYNEPENWVRDVKTNGIGTVNLIQNSLKFNIEKFIYFQTSLCYGNKPLQNPIKLSHPNFPGTNSYSISKTIGEDYLKLSGLNYVTFRLANVIGPRNLSGPLPIFYKRLKERKKCFVTKSRRDFVFVKDLANVVLQAVKGTGKGTYHFSCGKDVSIIELYDEVVKQMGLNDYPKPDIQDISKDEVRSILTDPEKTFEDFGKINFTSLDVIVKEAIEYYEKFGVGETFTHAKVKN
tara:strand:+ start:495 stop:1430 length:936 start_codon:yes stop_codon:yes gene_type:complete